MSVSDAKAQPPLYAYTDRQHMSDYAWTRPSFGFEEALSRLEPTAERYLSGTD